MMTIYSKRLAKYNLITGMPGCRDNCRDTVIIAGMQGLLLGYKKKII